MSINNLKRGRVSRFTFYSDSGHGWLKVPRHYLTALGIADQITSCSYQLGNNVYLEEDCDAGLFFDAFIADQGKKPEYSSKWTNNQSKIRKYQSYNSKSLPLESGDIYIGMPVNIYGTKYTVEGKAQRAWRVSNNSGQVFRAKINQIEAYISTN